MIRRWLWYRPVVAVAAVSMLVTAAVVISAIQIARSSHVRVPLGQTVNGHFHATGGTVDVIGFVNGNVNARAGYFYQLGPVAGDVSIVSGLAEVRGQVGGSVRVVAGVASIYGEIHGDVEFFGGQIRLMEGSHVQGNLTVHGADVLIVATARVDGDLRGQVGRVVIEGSVGTHVVPIARTVTVENTAAIGGDLNYESRQAAQISPGATVHGMTDRRDPAARLPFGSLLLWHSGAVIRALAIIGFGALVLLAAPRRLVAVADVARRAPTLSLVTGIGLWLFVPLALAVSSLFVVTLPLVGLLASLFALIAYSSMAVAGLGIGRRLLPTTTSDASRSRNLLPLIGGVTLIAAARVVPVPYLEVSLAALIAVLGVGAMGVHGWVGTARLEEESSNRLPVWLGVLVGAGIVALVLAAVLIALGGAAMVIATSSRSAIFTWEIAPRHLGLATLVLAAGSLGLLAIVLRVSHRSIPVRSGRSG